MRVVCLNQEWRVDRLYKGLAALVFELINTIQYYCKMNCRLRWRLHCNVYALPVLQLCVPGIARIRRLKALKMEINKKNLFLYFEDSVRPEVKSWTDRQTRS